VGSQQRAAQAWAEGRFARSVMPVKDILGVTLLERDETVRGATTLESLRRSSRSFAEMGEEYGADGVALLRYPEVGAHRTPASRRQLERHRRRCRRGARRQRGFRPQGGLKPRARIRVVRLNRHRAHHHAHRSDAGNAAGAEAARGMGAGDIDLFELNEAFASVVLRFMEALSIPHDKINVNGGAIAMGHPLGATGAMILGTLLDEMERRDLGTGLATLCVGAGMGTATIIERV
jgi:acetyl-CoA C-acetyltransferase